MINQLDKDNSSDAVKFIHTLSLTPTENAHEINAVDTTFSSKFETIKQIKGVKVIVFQIHTGATCNVIKASEIIGTKYQKQVAQTTQLLTMFNSTTLNSAGKCMIQVANPRIKQKHKIN